MTLLNFDNAHIQTRKYWEVQVLSGGSYSILILITKIFGLCIEIIKKIHKRRLRLHEVNLGSDVKVTKTLKRPQISFKRNLGVIICHLKINLITSEILLFNDYFVYLNRSPVFILN